MNADPTQPWRDLLMRRELTETEAQEVRDWLAAHPEAAADWALDATLSRALRRLPPVPVASNFTSRVMAEVHRGTPTSSPSPSRTGRPGQPLLAGWRRWLAGRWLPWAGGVAVLASAGLAGWQIQLAQRESDYTRQVAALRALADLPPAVIEGFEADFEAIQRYGETAAPVDFGLLAALE